MSYFNARYYDPAIGRFISVDPVKDGVNWYVYCRNNPLKFVDTNGLEEIEILIGLDPNPYVNIFAQGILHLTNLLTGLYDYSNYLSTGLSVNYNGRAEMIDFQKAYISDETKYIVVVGHGSSTKAGVGDFTGSQRDISGLIVNQGEIANLSTFEGLEKGNNLTAIFIIGCYQNNFNSEWNQAAGVLVFTFGDGLVRQVLEGSDFYHYDVPSIIVKIQKEGLKGLPPGLYYRGTGHGYSSYDINVRKYKGMGSH